jgi:GT2 family glycosyltransferase
MKIWCFTPFTPDKNLGKAYNEYCELVPNDDDWIIIKDADVMFLTPDFLELLTDHIKDHPNTGIFTCLTNRIGSPAQLYGGKISENADIKHHRKIAMSIKDNKTSKLCNHVISGMMMCFKKSTWRKVGGFPEDKIFLGVDYGFSRKVLNDGMVIRIMTNIYIFHYYRLVEGNGYTDHLK